MKPEPYISVVIPVYNEEGIIVSATRNILRHLERRGWTHELILMENGSRDRTWELVQMLAAQFPAIRGYQVGSPGHGDYGLALKTGALAARGELVVNDEIDIGNFDFYDQAVDILKNQNTVDMVIGSKALDGNNDERGRLRQLATFTVNCMLKILLGFKGTDTHGLKVWRRAVLEKIVAACVTGKDMLASELVIRAERSGAMIHEIPIHIEEKRQARVNIFKRIPHVLKNIFELFVIFHVKEGTVFAEALRYILIAVINVFVNAIVFNALMAFSKITAGPWIFAFSIVSFAVATTNAFFWNKRWVFRHTARSHLGTYSTFVAISSSMALVGSLITYLLTTFVHPHLSAHLWANIALIVSIPVTFVGNFFGNKLFVFNTSSGRTVPTEKRYRQWFFAAVAVVGFFFVTGFSLYHLSESPATWYDEGVNIQVALNDTVHGYYGLQVAPNTYVSGVPFVTTGYPVLIPIRLVFALLGVGLFQGRLVMAFFIVACIAMLFVLAKKLYGLALASESLLLLVTFPPLYGHGKNILGEVPGTFFMAIFLYCLIRIERAGYKGFWLYAMAGLSAGLCIVTKPLFILLVPAIVIAVVIHRRSIRWRWSRGMSGALMAFLPIIFWFFLHASSGVSISKVATFYANPGSITDPLKQIVSNVALFVHDSKPLYFAIVMVVWLIAYSIRRYQGTSLSVAETVAFTFSLLVSAAYFRTIGYYRYFFPAELFAIVFLPSALMTMVRGILSRRTTYARFMPAIVGAVIVFILLGQTHSLLFSSWVSKSVDEKPDGYAAYFSSISATSTIFVYNVPEAVIFLGNHQYYQYINTKPTGLFEFGAEEVSMLHGGIPDFLVVKGKDFNDLASTTFKGYLIAQTFPDFDVARSIRNRVSKQ